MGGEFDRCLLRWAAASLSLKLVMPAHGIRIYDLWIGGGNQEQERLTSLIGSIPSRTRIKSVNLTEDFWRDLLDAESASSCCRCSGSGRPPAEIWLMTDPASPFVSFSLSSLVSFSLSSLVTFSLSLWVTFAFPSCSELAARRPAF